MAPEVTAAVGPEIQMWVTFALIGLALALYALERAPMELTSIGVICALLVFFHFFPVTGAAGADRLGPVRILQGFANPALITVLALLVIGQGMVRTGVLDKGAGLILGLGGGRAWLSMVVVLGAVLVISAFLNNIPVVVIFIPIMQALAARFGRSVSKVMIPLSFAAVLGGMTTLIGSSTNLLVNSALIEMSVTPFGFFDFSVPGLVLAAVGLVYLLVVAPRLLPERASLADALVDGSGKQFIAQMTVSGDSELVGKGAPGGLFDGLPEMTLRMVQRREEAILPPFEGLDVRPGDVLVVAATRKALTGALSHDPGLLFPDLRDGRAPGTEPREGTPDQPWHGGDRMLAEVMIVPASRMIGQTLPQIGFRYKTGCIVLGIQRRARMIRTRLTDIRLRAGDELLIQGRPEDVNRLRHNPDVVLIEWSAEELPALTHARRASLIFFAVVALAASGLVPIVVAALSGAAAMVAVGVLNLRQAFRAVDPLIVTTIAAALALGIAMKETGGAVYLARNMVDALGDASPATVLSLFFLLVAGLSNVITTKATAVLFTPIAVDLARELAVDPAVFAVAVVFAANCSFASPVGYQTNLLVMGAGHYRFADFARVGLPLIVILWLVFSRFAPWYYGI
ncbi:MAG: SLC13 family permease [Rhodospirillales bacterium]